MKSSKTFTVLESQRFVFKDEMRKYVIRPIFKQIHADVENSVASQIWRQVLLPVTTRVWNRGMVDHQLTDELNYK